MSSLIAKNLQVGSDPTATNNFTIFQPATPDGTLRIGNGNTGITSSLLTLTSGGNFGLGLSPAGQSGFRTLELGGSGVSGLLDLYQGTSRQMRLYNSGSNINIANNTSGGSTLFINVNASVGFFESMRLDSSGNLGLGVTPSAWASGFKAIQVAANAAVWGGTGTTGPSYFTNNVLFDGARKYINTAAASEYQQASGSHIWQVAPSGTAGNAISFTQAMSLTAAGELLVGTTSAIGKLGIKGNTSSPLIRADQDNTSYSTNNFYSVVDVSASGTGYAHFAAYSGVSGVGFGDVFKVYGNGNVVNLNNSYGSISDIKLKENIVDATPKLEKLCQVRVVNYNLKISPDHKQLGVIAQELEQIFPGMIEEAPDRDKDGNDLGTTSKHVKYSVFVPMLVKAIQELKAEFDAYKATHP